MIFLNESNRIIFIFEEIIFLNIEKYVKLTAKRKSILVRVNRYTIVILIHCQEEDMMEKIIKINLAVSSIA